jgi:simple sugar transport system ATP-binding protein
MTMVITDRPPLPTGALGLEVIGMTKRFGALAALDDVSMQVAAGSVHALLGENGAGKSTLVKCVMGYYHPDAGQMVLADREITVANPRDAHLLGIGMVYQHFTLVPGMTVAENLMLAKPDRPLVIDWPGHNATLEKFLDTMPFRVPLDTPVASLAAGDKQKAEILKQLFLHRRFLILDEPTSVLTPQEADEMLGLLRNLAHEQELTVLMITHKFREVLAFADAVTVLRRGRFAGSGLVGDLSTADMAEMMIGSREMPATAKRSEQAAGEPRLAIKALTVLDDTGLPAVEALSLTVRAGEIFGIAGVSGNGQHELVEALGGQRDFSGGSIEVNGKPYRATRAEMTRHHISLLPEEPLKNACVPRMSVAENLAFRSFDRPPFAAFRCWLRKGEIVARARTLIERFRIKTPGPEAPISTLSGGNVQRTVLARELNESVSVLIVANPCFGLDFAAVAEIRERIVAARNRGAAVLLVSEDLDELFELADVIGVMFDGKLVYQSPIAAADLRSVGQHMAGH